MLLGDDPSFVIGPWSDVLCQEKYLGMFSLRRIPSRLEQFHADLFLVGTSGHAQPMHASGLRGKRNSHRAAGATRVGLFSELLIRLGFGWAYSEGWLSIVLVLRDGRRDRKSTRLTPVT